ncbi:hypothetical protein E2C01_099629 [Portunus trituberculatus]|uniref:Uncharacterized protein n=1 Tax=Portunus trituberculatus TaxID=210409 RepID=A0A5B7KBF1_PORTR|nr:hypothetical protein [Portunus trituberculatus]
MVVSKARWSEEPTEPVGRQVTTLVGRSVRTGSREDPDVTASPPRLHIIKNISSRCSGMVSSMTENWSVLRKHTATPPKVPRALSRRYHLVYP